MPKEDELEDELPGVIDKTIKIGLTADVDDFISIDETDVMLMGGEIVESPKDDVSVGDDSITKVVNISEPSIPKKKKLVKKKKNNKTFINKYIENIENSIQNKKEEKEEKEEVDKKPNDVLLFSDAEDD